MPPNAYSNWDQHWKNMRSISQFYETVQDRQFEMYQKILQDRISSQSNVLEFGGGTGGLCARFAEHYKCNCTIVDSSKQAKEFFEAHYHSPSIKYRLMDAFAFTSKNRFDVVFSDGLIEHFVGKTQEKLIQIHKSAAKKEGYVVLVVPRNCKRYSVISQMMKTLQLWNFGFERPYTLSELTQLCEQNGLTVENSVQGFWEISVLCRKC